MPKTTYRIDFEFRKEFEVDAASVEEAEEKIVALIKWSLDLWRDEEDCCSFKLLTNNLNPAT